MKKIILGVLTCLMGGLTACTDYQDEITALDKRVTILEQLVDRTNSDIVTLQALIDAMEAGDVIKQIEPLVDAKGNQYGYRIQFLNHDPIEVTDGKDGTDGKSAVTPVFNVARNADDVYCWQVSYDGGVSFSWVLDDQGKQVKAVGADGKDGKSVTPKLQIDDQNRWLVSYDEGETWEILVDPVTKLPLSAKGADGKDAATTFKDISKVYSPDGMTAIGWRFTLQNGDSFTVDMFVMAQSVVIRRDGTTVSAPIVVAKDEVVELTAVIYPENTLYKDVLWFVSEGDAANFTITMPNNRTTTVIGKASGTTAKIRALARYSEPGKPIVYGEVTIVCN